MTLVIKQEVLRRLATVKSTVHLVKELEGNGQFLESKELKGLLFIQMYAVYEYCVKRGFSSVVDEFNSRNLTIAQISDNVLPLVLNSYFVSIMRGSIQKTWDRRLDLFARRWSTATAAIEEVFPKDGSQFRYSQLVLLWKMLGISSPSLPEARLRGILEEIVSNRNEVAHGESSPDDVGGRYSYADLESRLRDVELICTYYLSEIDAHISNARAFL